MEGYALSRRFFDWCFENPEAIKPTHVSIYFFAMEHCNRLGWKDKFGFPSQMAMEALGIKKHQTFISHFKELCEWGFIKLIKKSTNQYSANVISLQTAMPKNGKALDKAFIKHRAKQTLGEGKSTGQSNGIGEGHIIEQGTINKEQGTINHSEKKWFIIIGSERIYDIDQFLTENFQHHYEGSLQMKPFWKDRHKAFHDYHGNATYDTPEDFRKHYTAFILSNKGNKETDLKATGRTAMAGKDYSE